MPTPAERLATLEANTRENREDLDRILHELNGGGAVEYTRSVRGRLHKLESLNATAENLAEAARQMRRVQDRRWSRRWQALAAVAGLSVAVAPWLAPILYR